jgi:hypothetical protein
LEVNIGLAYVTGHRTAIILGNIFQTFIGKNWGPSAYSLFAVQNQNYEALCHKLRALASISIRSGAVTLGTDTEEIAALKQKAIGEAMMMEVVRHGEVDRSGDCGCVISARGSAAS